MDATAKAWPAMSIAQAHAMLTAPGTRFEIAEASIHGIRTRVWKNAPPTLRELFLVARSYGGREFLINDDERVSYENFARASLAIAAELRRLGVVKGDRVAIIARNIPEWPAMFFGAALVGAIVTPLNAWWTGAELEYGLIDSGAKIAFVDAERLGRLTEHFTKCSALERVYVCRHPEGAVHHIVTRLEDVIGKVSSWEKLPVGEVPDVPLAPDDDATILYTSGTTGMAKGALGTHRNMLSNIMAAGLSGARNFLRRGEPVPMLDPMTAPPRITLLSIPLFHATGCFAVLGPTMMVGGKLVLMRKWDPELAMQLIEREKVNQAGGVPTIAWQLLEHPARAKYDLSSLDSVGYGGAPSAPELVRKLKATFPNSLPGNGWGMTETSATCTHHSGEDYLNRPDSCGPPVPVCDLKIMSIDGARELPVGEVGELWARGPNMVRGYWNKPKETAHTFVDGWVRTGDLARLDEEGFCYIIDRAKDMLIRGGENIYCIEVESVLYEHPAVIDAAVVPIPHHTLGEEPGAIVHLKAGMHATEQELRGLVASKLAAFKVPVKIVFWPEPLPRNANGKLQKIQLRKVFAQAAEA
ncbi:MAG: acyl--CoA ligase [Alphaproteobacteria bacterium]|nr:acyl--CoA ligase [Alphaproteobacteria bacterium]MDE2264640.1 acyl--CoA ligase [Alphaproteobacteria bacterium]